MKKKLVETPERMLGLHMAVLNIGAAMMLNNELRWEHPGFTTKENKALRRFMKESEKAHTLFVNAWNRCCKKQGVSI